MLMRSENIYRKKIPQAIEAQVLIQSRRRCCLCFHFHNDIGIKNGQIAHINRRRNDNDESNLAFLCFEHHDQYDSTRSQSKGITSSEIQHAKRLLYNTLSQEMCSEPIRITISIEGEFDKLQPMEREILLKKALTAAQVENNPKIVDTKPGSIKFTIEVIPEDAVRILAAFSQNKLADDGVKEISIENSVGKANTTFSQSFEQYGHGLSKRQALDALLNPDSSIRINDVLQATTDGLDIGLYIKQLSYRHSVLLIVALTPDAEITCALPINHDEISFKRGDSPWEVLKTFVEKYGAELEFDNRRSLIWVNENIHIPWGVNSYTELVHYLEECARRVTTGNYELISVITHPTIISRITNIRLMFAISKDRYYPSLRRLGINASKGKSGRFILPHFRK